MATRQKWRLSLVILVAAAIGIFVSMSNKGTEQRAAVSQNKIVVVMNAGPKETDKVAVKRLKEDIARFNELYPEIEIRWTDRPYSPDSFATSMAGGTAEDIISLWATEGYVAERGYALDLTAMISQWEYKEQLNMKVLQPFVQKEKIYALPTNGYIMGLWYNKRLFKENGLVDSAGQPKPPQTWEEFVQCAAKLANREKGIAGFGIMGNGAEAGWGLLNWVWQAGGDFQRQVDGKWQAVFDSPQAVTALDFIKALRWRHNVLQTNLLSTAQELQQRFAAGQIGMMFGSNDWIPNLINQYDMNPADIGMALLPAGPAGRANQMGGNYYIINPQSSPEVQKAAFKWIAWRVLGTVSPERIEERGEDLRRQGQVGVLSALPIFTGEADRKARVAAAAYKDVLVDFPDVWKEAAKYMRPEPPFFCQQLYSEYLGPAIQEILTTKNADSKTLLIKAASGFQDRFLNNLAK